LSKLNIPILYINLDSDWERKQRMESEFEKFQLDASRLDAIRWSLLSEEKKSQLYSESLNQQQFHVPLVAGEKGCYASHHKAWNWLVESGRPAMVVLEDDVQIKSQLMDVINSLESINFDWDMIKLIGREKEKVRARKNLAKDIDLIEYKRVPSLTAGYIISRAGAMKLLQKRQPFGRPIDVDLRYWWECDILILGISPPCLILADSSFTSSIGQKIRGLSWQNRWKKFLIKLKMSSLNIFHSIRRGSIL
jgi:glycosyl transferase, family 25